MVLQCEPSQPGAPPPAPEHFDDARYAPPPHRVYPTAAKHAHPRDAALRFYEAPHIYTLDGKPVSTSVTSIAHDWSEHFDGAAAIGAMKGSTKQAWPRLEYTRGAQRVTDVDALAGGRACLLVVDGARTASVLKAGDLSPDATGIETLTVLRDLAGRPLDAADDEAWYIFERALTDAEILEQWSHNGMLARNKGTEAHLQMQLLAEGCPHRTDDREVVVGLSFFARIPDEWHVYRTEWEIGSAAHDVAGSIDLVIRNARTGRVRIIDYKRADKLPDRLHGFKKMRGEMRHLDDCDGARYALQLSLYQWLLMHVYGLEVDDADGRILLSIHPDRPFWTSVPYLAEEVEWIFAHRASLAAARDACPHRCPLTDVCLADAVRAVGDADDQEVVVDRKAATLRGWRILGPDAPTLEAVRAHLDATTFPPPPTKLTPWRARMPKDGMLPSF